MRHELRGESANLLASKAPFEQSEGTPGQVYRNLRFGLIHRKQETIARNADLCAERLPQRLTYSKRAVFNRVMLVNLQVALAGQLERKSAVLVQLLEHVIEKTDAGGHLN